MRKVLGNGIFEVRRSKERCPEHQITGLVRHCPREIFKQIAGVLGLVCHPAKGFLGNLCLMLLDSKDCDRLLALKQDMLILVVMMAAVPAVMMYKSDSPGIMTFLRRIGPPKFFVPYTWTSTYHLSICFYRGWWRSRFFATFVPQVFTQQVIQCF